LLFLDIQELALLQARSLHAQHQRIEYNRNRWKAQHTATNAAALALDEDKFELAVELSEQGRTTILNRLGRLRTPLDALRKINNSLANHFADLSQQLDQTLISDPNSSIFEEEATMDEVAQ
jgi:hypothetical protein